MNSDRLIIYTDGASRGNPGPAAIGVVVRDGSGRILDTISLCLGHATNNQAEYRAIIAGLEKALALGASHVDVRSDSELVVRQLTGEYKVKNSDLKPLFQKVEGLRSRLFGLTVSYIPREDNQDADRLANEALDGHPAADSRTPHDISVRPAAEADIPFILPILVEIEGQHVDALPRVFRPNPHSERVKMLGEIMADQSSALLVAEQHGEVVGYINLAVKEVEDNAVLVPRRYVKIRDLAVSKKHHRSGAGSALMQAAERWARERGVDTLELSVWEFNRGALAFYQEMGYSTAAREMWKRI